MKVLPKGTEYNLSEVGHRNFLYPSDKKFLLEENIEVDLLPYMSGSISKPKAFKVLSGALKGQIIWTQTKED